MLYTVGNIVGSLFTGVCDHFGRRAGMMVGSILIVAGAAVQTAAQDVPYLLGGRLLLGFGVSIGRLLHPLTHLKWLLEHGEIESLVTTIHVIKSC